MKRAGRRHAGAFLAVALAGGLATRPAAAQCPDGSPPPCRAPSSRTPRAPPPNSVAVLYFDNLSPDTADAYLADGLTEELIARLGEVTRLQVKSRNAVQRFRGRAAEDPAALGHALSVTHLVSGSVRRAGGRLRVTVELVRTATGLRLWGDQYDRTDADLLAIQEDIARSVATAVAGRLLPREQAALRAPPTHNAVAYDHFLRGNYYLAQRTPRSVARAIEEYQAAATEEPAFTAALARLAFGYWLFLEWTWDYPGTPRESLAARGLAASARALRQDPRVADAWLARGVLLMTGDSSAYAGARAAIERAIALDPRNAEAHHRYAFLLLSLGDDVGAVAAAHRALAVDPHRAVTLFFLAMPSMIGRRFGEARSWLDSAVAVDPAFYLAYARRALVRLQLGEVAGAQADAELALQLSGGHRLPGEAALVLVDARRGDTLAARTRSRRLLEAILDSVRPTAREARFVAPALVAAGESEQALALLERVRPRTPALWLELRVPEFDAIRSDPRFQRMVADSRPFQHPR